MKPWPKTTEPQHARPIVGQIAGAYAARSPFSVALFFVVVFVLALAYSIASHLPELWRVLSYKAGSVAFFCCVLGLIVVRVRSSAKVDAGNRVALHPDTTWITLCGFVSADAYFTMQSRYAIGFASVLWLAVLGARVWRKNYRLPMAIAVIAMVSVTAQLAYFIAISPTSPGMDLIPITKAAIHYFVQGVDPYQADYRSVSLGPFFYLPLEWLSYLPFELLGINLHWVNFACWVGIIVVFERTLVAADDRVLPRLVFYPVIASLPVLQAMDTEAPPMWLGEVCFMAALLRGRMVLASLLLGCLLATSQLMLAVAGLSEAFFLRGLSIPRVTFYALLTAGTALLLLGPFIVSSPNFLYTVFIARPSIAISGWHSARNAYNSVGFNSLPLLLNAERARSILQLGVLAAGALFILLWGSRSVAGFLYDAGIVFLCAIALNGQIWRYYYYGPLLMISWGIAFSGTQRKITARRSILVPSSATPPLARGQRNGYWRRGGRGLYCAAWP